MKIAVAARPVEKFDTELKLPAWQIEPDDEAIQADPNNYQYVDEQGNLIDPIQNPPAGKGKGRIEDGTAPDQGDVPPAANRDFLDQATGRKAVRVQRGPAVKPPAGN